LKKHIGITGGSGFIGLSLARHLGRKYCIKLIDTKPPPKNLLEIATFVPCDIRNFPGLSEALKEVDLVIHAAIVQIPLINEKKRLAYEVNLIGTQNVCEIVAKNPKTKGMILVGTWHTIGERGLNGIVDEEFGFRPDKVEDRARLYALSKIGQESIVRFFAETTQKGYGIIRMGTVLGEGMPKETAANIFIENGLSNKALTPYKHSMYRPMLYVDIKDVCTAFEAFAEKILSDEFRDYDDSLGTIVNVLYPEPITILELAKIVRNGIIKLSAGKIKPQIKIVDKGLPSNFGKEQAKSIEVDVRKAYRLLGLEKFVSPKESIERLIQGRYH
jgi:nucleoside-diphosphate-sugar epimerase